MIFGSGDTTGPIPLFLSVCFVREIWTSFCLCLLYLHTAHEQKNMRKYRLTLAHSIGCICVLSVNLLSRITPRAPTGKHQLWGYCGNRLNVCGGLVEVYERVCASGGTFHRVFVCVQARLITDPSNHVRNVENIQEFGEIVMQQLKRIWQQTFLFKSVSVNILLC